MFVTDLLWSYLACILLASFGGLARVLNMSNSTPITAKIVAKEIISSTFAGVIALLILTEFDVKPAWIGAACGGIGYLGLRTLDTLIPAIIKKKTGLDIKKEEEKS